LFRPRQPQQLLQAQQSNESKQAVKKRAFQQKTQATPIGRNNVMTDYPKAFFFPAPDHS